MLGLGFSYLNMHEVEPYFSLHVIVHSLDDDSRFDVLQHYQLISNFQSNEILEDCLDMNLKTSQLKLLKKAHLSWSCLYISQIGINLLNNKSGK